MPLRTLALSILLGCLASNTRAATSYSWGHGYGDEDTQTLNAVAIDPSSNALFCGGFLGSITIKTTLTATFGGSDFLVAKLDPVGNPVWNRRLTYGNDDVANDVTSDKDGNVIAVGTGGGKIVIVKYDAAGTQQWIKAIGSANAGGVARCVATNLANDVIVAGYFWGVLDLGGGPMEESTPPLDGYEMFLARFASNGNHVWSRHFGWKYNGTALAGLKADALGEVALFGDFVEPIDFGGGTLTSDGFNDLFLAKFTRDGRLRWSYRYGNTNLDPSVCMALKADGYAAICSNLYAPVNFGGGALTPTASPEPCIAVFAPDGTHAWSKRIAGTTYGFGGGIAFAEDDILLSCTGQGTLDFGGGPVAATGINYNVFLARLAGDDGAHRWSFAYGGAGNVDGRIAENRGRIIVGGTMDDAANPGGTPLPFSGGTDMYMARFDETLTGVRPAPSVASLEQNIPNPFNPITTIRYTLAMPSRVTISVHDASGRTVRRIDDGAQPAGTHAVVWNGRDDTGRAVASGVYFYRLEGVPGVPARKMVLLK